MWKGEEKMGGARGGQSQPTLKKSTYSLTSFGSKDATSSSSVMLSHRASATGGCAEPTTCSQ